MIRRFLALNLQMILPLSACPIAALALVIGAAWRDLPYFGWFGLLQFALALFLIPLGATVAGAVLISLLVTPINALIAILNGAPFKKGDKVRILLPGPRSGQSCQVAGFGQGQTLLVKFGDGTSGEYGQFQVLRDRKGG
jgi:hypothetical protein